jgi:hypothetical protein
MVVKEASGEVSEEAIPLAKEISSPTSFHHPPNMSQRQHHV